MRGGGRFPRVGRWREDRGFGGENARGDFYDGDGKSSDPGSETVVGSEPNLLVHAFVVPTSRKRRETWAPTGVVLQERTRQASLDRTAEGDCPYKFSIHN